MADSKKVSFGFQKQNKKNIVLPIVVKHESNVQYIDCVEEKAIKVIGAVDNSAEKLLVIPLFKQPNLKSTAKLDTKEASNFAKNDVAIKVNEPESLDAIAAREILEDVQKAKKEAEETRIFTVPLTTNPPAGEKESSLDDYESVPIVDFGLAMLRGMGWKEGKGIGKTEKLVTTSIPTLRPKGMGLGADAVVKSFEPSANLSKDEVVLKSGSCVRVVAGPHKDSYGKVEGFDEISSRVIINLTLTNTTVSFNEFMVQVVSKDDFNKNSKVINVAKFEEYKEKERNPIVSNESTGTEQRTGPNHSKNKFAHKKSKKYRSSSEDSSSSSQENHSNQLYSRRRKEHSSSDTSSSHSHSPGSSTVSSRHKYKGQSVSHRRHKTPKHRRTSVSVSPERPRHHSKKSKRKI